MIEFLKAIGESLFAHLNGEYPGVFAMWRLAHQYNRKPAIVEGDGKTLKFALTDTKGNYFYLKYDNTITYEKPDYGSSSSCSDDVLLIIPVRFVFIFTAKANEFALEASVRRWAIDKIEVRPREFDFDRHLIVAEEQPGLAEPPNLDRIKIAALRADLIFEDGNIECTDDLIPFCAEC